MSDLTPKELSNLTPEQARDILWEQGEAWQFLLDDLQKKVVSAYQTSDRGKEIILVYSRQSGKCLIESTLVATPSGSKQIKDIQIGDIVYARHDNGTIYQTEVKQLHKQGIKKVVDLKHRGRVIASSTLDHRWLSWDTYKKQTTLKTTEELIKSPYRFKIKREYFDYVGGDVHEPHAYTIGALLGDGYGKHNRSTPNQVLISSIDDAIPQTIAKELGCLYWKQTGNNYSWILSNLYKVGKGKSSTPIIINNYKWCKGLLAHEKYCDYELIKTWTRESQVRFIAGILDTDGSIYVTGRNENELKFSLSMQSKSVVDAIQKLVLDLWQIELCVDIDDRARYKNGPCHLVYSNNNFCVKRMLKELTPHLVSEWKKYKPEYDKFPEYNHVPDFVGIVAGDVYEAETYDLGIDTENHLYILANGLVTHNSYSLFTLAYCACLANPNFHVTYVAPTLKMAKKITKMTMREVTKTAPKSCLAKFNTQDSEYNFDNGSKIELAGFNAGQIDDSRGGKSNIVIVDECGFMDEHEFDYGVSSVLYPKLNSTKGAMIMCSTLPKTQSHPYWQRVLKAKIDGRLVEGNIYDCPRYTKEDIDKFADRVGGYDSIDFRREYMNELVTDEDSAVIPEATKERMNLIVKKVDPPAFYDTYVSMDIGFKDYTAILFGYYDFLRNTVVIEDEAIIKGTKVTTASIAELIRTKEEALWGAKSPYMRIADNNNLILLNELTQPPYNLPIFPTAKDNREAAINKVRLLIQKEQIRIHPRCITLIQHVQHATWNSKRTDFARDPHNGHHDALAALIYFCRNIQYSRNPYPPEYMMTQDAFYINMANDGYDRPKDSFQQHIKDIFSPFAKKNNKPF